MANLCLIIPVYNGMPHLRATVEAALNQEYSNFELLISDDGSTDGSIEFVNNLSDTRIRLIRGPGKGLSHNMNAAIRQTNASFIARCDQDDISHPERLKLQYTLMKKGEWPALFSYITKFSRYNEWDNRERQVTTNQLIEPLHSLEDGAILHSTIMFRREAFEAVGGYRQHCYPCDDWDLQLRLEEYAQLHNCNIGIVARPLLRYRMHAEANTHDTFFIMQKKKRWVEHNAIRRRSDQDELSFSAYEKQEKGRFFKNLNRKRKDYYHYHFRLGGERYLNRSMLSCAFHMLCAALVAPERFIKRISTALETV